MLALFPFMKEPWDIDMLFSLGEISDFSSLWVTSDIEKSWYTKDSEKYPGWRMRKVKNQYGEMLFNSSTHGFGNSVFGQVVKDKRDKPRKLHRLNSLYRLAQDYRKGLWEHHDLRIAFFKLTNYQGFMFATTYRDRTRPYKIDETDNIPGNAIVGGSVFEQELRKNKFGYEVAKLFLRNEIYHTGGRAGVDILNYADRVFLNTTNINTKLTAIHRFFGIEADSKSLTKRESKCLN